MTEIAIFSQDDTPEPITTLTYSTSGAEIARIVECEDDFEAIELSLTCDLGNGVSGTKVSLGSIGGTRLSSLSVAYGPGIRAVPVPLECDGDLLDLIAPN